MTAISVAMLAPEWWPKRWNLGIFRRFGRVKKTLT